ncbi:MAG: riboflavin synthase, partial [Acidimicrobiia bacterium]|nr:riboflavin synthase [Acidimicrobiia bacterium]
SVPEALERYLVYKGSVAVDGVALTVTAVTGRAFEVALIPHTLASTTLGSWKVGDKANIEVDILAKYVEKLLVIRT